MITEWLDEDRAKLQPLFETHRRGRVIIFSAFDTGHGRLWVNSLESPTVARLQRGIINAVAGNSSSPDAEELIGTVEQLQLVITPDDHWNQIIRNIWGERLGIQHRTMLSPDSLDLKRLKALRNQLPSEYSLERMDLETIQRLDKQKFMHIPLFFGSSEDFYMMGIGYCIRHEGKILSVASTFMPFKDEFEIDVRTIDTEHRRMGLATVVSAALMIHALENGLVPHWDAANEASVGLALKLGYTNPEPWEAYYLKPLE